AAYNNAIADGTLQRLTPPRSSERGLKPWPIAKSPYFAVPLCAGIPFTMGGSAVDQDMRALRPDGSPIPGLFAAGKSAGGLEGGEAVGYVGGLSLSLITALRTAEAIARDNAATTSANETK